MLRYETLHVTSLKLGVCRFCFIYSRNKRTFTLMHQECVVVAATENTNGYSLH